MAKYEFKTIRDNYKSVQEVQRALRDAGLESSNLIVGIDFTGSNMEAGEKSFNGRCLHDVTGPTNPYQQVIGIVGRTLEAFDDDHLIPAFGFGDFFTTNKSCFPFFPDRPCAGLREVLERYKEIAPGIRLSGPTNFAPIIDKAIETVRETKAYHILVLIADGQVNNEEDTVRAIVQASAFPLSIVVIGVGDGPWEMMHRFDDELPQRKFDNFQFVCFNELKERFRELDGAWASPEATSEVDAFFAMSMLMELPDQYKAIRQLRLLGAA